MRGRGQRPALRARLWVSVLAVLAVAAATLAAPAVAQAPSGQPPEAAFHEDPDGHWAGPGEAELTWGPVPGADSYDVRFYSLDYHDNDGWIVLDANEAVEGISIVFDGASASLSGLPHMSSWWFGVRARNTADASNMSECRYLTACLRTTAIVVLLVQGLSIWALDPPR